MAAITKVFRYYHKRVGWHYEVWYAYADGTKDPNGAWEWRASYKRYWRWLPAAKQANDLQIAYNAGLAAGEYIDEIAPPVSDADFVTQLMLREPSSAFLTSEAVERLTLNEALVRDILSAYADYLEGAE